MTAERSGLKRIRIRFCFFCCYCVQDTLLWLHLKGLIVIYVLTGLVGLFLLYLSRHIFLSVWESFCHYILEYAFLPFGKSQGPVDIYCALGVLKFSEFSWFFFVLLTVHFQTACFELRDFFFFLRGEILSILSSMSSIRFYILLSILSHWKGFYLFWFLRFLNQISLLEIQLFLNVIYEACRFCCFEILISS